MEVYGTIWKHKKKKGGFPTLNPTLEHKTLSNFRMASDFLFSAKVSVSLASVTIWTSILFQKSGEGVTRSESLRHSMKRVETKIISWTVKISPNLSPRYLETFYNYMVMPMILFYIKVLSIN